MLKLARMETVRFGTERVTLVTTEELTLAEDGKVLNDVYKSEKLTPYVGAVDEPPRILRNSTLVFNKK
jgi:hypothetical protein